MKSQNRVRYVPLLAAGVLVFLGLVMLGGLTGLLWHIRTFGWWMNLNPSVLGPTADWLIWAASFLLTVLPSTVVVVRRKISLEPVVVLTCFVFPVSSLAVMSWSHHVGATLLVGSGFLAAYTLVSKAKMVLGMEASFALRVVLTEVFGFLAMAAAGSVASVLLWNGGMFHHLDSTFISDPLGLCLAVDLEVFYISRPILTAVFVTLAVAAFVALFRESFSSVAQLIFTRLMREKPALSTQVPTISASRSGREISAQRLFPYLILAASVALGLAVALYPYTVVGVEGVLGSDSWFYLQNLRSMNTLADGIRLLHTDRGFFLIVLFLVRIATGLSPEWVVRLMPALLSAMLAVSSFVLVKEGTGRSWVAAFAALLSVVSAQTSLGMGAGIITNWFALSLANLTFALIIRSIRLHSAVAAVGSLVFSLVLLASYALLWAIVIGVLVLALLASIISLREENRREWKYEVSMLGGLLFGSLLIPVAFLYLAAIPLLGFRPEGLDPRTWLGMGWGHVTGGATPQVLASALLAIEEAFDFAGNRADLPFLTILSILGMLDLQQTQARSFRRIIAATVLVAVAATLITPGLRTWRGLYLVPMYLMGALGAETVIRGVNGQQSHWSSYDRLAFAGTFAAYIFLSHLSYSLRALELLILAGS